MERASLLLEVERAARCENQLSVFRIEWVAPPDFPNSATLFVVRYSKHAIYEYNATTGEKLGGHIHGVDDRVFIAVGPIK